MAHCERCGARKLKKRQDGRWAGFFFCRKCGPVGPRPKLEALILGIPVELRNAILDRQCGVATEDGRRAVQAEMIAAHRRERTDERAGHDVPDLV